MPGLFQELDGETCILIRDGVYTECRVYVRNPGELFARIGNGFVRLYADGVTSKSKARLDTLTVNPLYCDELGRLQSEKTNSNKLVSLPWRFHPHTGAN